MAFNEFHTRGIPHMNTAKRTMVVVLACALMPVLLHSPADAAPQARKYSSCKALNKKFPNGIAKSRAMAKEAVSFGNRKPRVSPSVYKANKSLDIYTEGYMCVRDAVVAAGPDTTPATAPTLTPPPAVANLTMSPQSPVRGDAAARFSAAWQVPVAASVESFVATLPDGTSKTVNFTDGVNITPDVRQYSIEGWAPFGHTVSLQVFGVNAAGRSPASTVTVQMPPAPKSTVTVQITAGTGDCGGWSWCYVNITNATGGTDTHGSMGTWSYEATPGLHVTAYVNAQAPNPSFCEIKFDGVVVSTQTSNGASAWCSSTVR